MARPKKDSTQIKDLPKDETLPEEVKTLIDVVANKPTDTVVHLQTKPEYELQSKTQLNVIEQPKVDLVKELFESNPENRLFKAMEEYMDEFGVTEEVAIKHAQKVLNIGQTGIYDERTRSAFAQSGNISDLINDYKNQRK